MKIVLDKEGIAHLVTNEGAIGDIPVFAINGKWEPKSSYVEEEDSNYSKLKINKILSDYIDICFIDFKDEGRYKSEHDAYFIKIDINIKDENISKTIDGHTNLYKYRLEQLDIIDSCLDKIRIKYKRLFYMIEFSNTLITLVISPFKISAHQKELCDN